MRNKRKNDAQEGFFNERVKKKNLLVSMALEKQECFKLCATKKFNAYLHAMSRLTSSPENYNIPEVDLRVSVVSELCSVLIKNTNTYILPQPFY